MSNQDGHNADSPREPLLTDKQSKDAIALSLVRELNERCLELIVQLARSDLAAGTPEAVVVNRALWCGLDAPGRSRAAHYPFLLVDINFANPGWWRWAANPQTAERKGGAPAHLPSKLASELMRETTALAWIIARSDPRLGTVLCGMAPPVARLFASFGTPDIERIAARHSRHLRLRFEDHPTFWQSLLRMAGSRPVHSLPSPEPPYAENFQQRLF